MSFKSTNSKYTNCFVGHVLRFIEEYRLFEKDSSLLIAVSGGIDSMVLVHILKMIQSYGYSNELRVVHINHNTRVGQDREEQFVQEYCKYLEIDCTCTTLADLNPNKNFEYNARLKRYDAFYAVANPGDKIVLAHHIDDSFEWTMLQSLRSSSIEGLIGIPVKNGRVIRPFMAVTKEQIRRYASYLDIPFIEDPTNEQIKYERNFIRNNVISAFSDRYRKYLKHYVYRHNEISRRLGLHCVNKHQTSFNISYNDKSVLIYSILGKGNLSGIQELILKGLKHLNPHSRGKVSSQIENVVTAMKNNKYGPISLSGGVLVYIDFNVVLMTRENESKLKLVMPEYRKFSYDQFVNYVEDKMPKQLMHFDFPFLVVIKGTALDKRSFNTSFNKATVLEIKKDKLTYYPALKLIREWSKKKNRHKALWINYYSSL